MIHACKMLFRYHIPSTQPPTSRRLSEKGGHRLAMAVIVPATGSPRAGGATHTPRCEGRCVATRAGEDGGGQALPAAFQSSSAVQTATEERAEEGGRWKRHSHCKWWGARAARGRNAVGGKRVAEGGRGGRDARPGRPRLPAFPRALEEATAGQQHQRPMDASTLPSRR